MAAEQDDRLRFGRLPGGVEYSGGGGVFFAAAKPGVYSVGGVALGRRCSPVRLIGPAGITPIS